MTQLNLYPDDYVCYFGEKQIPLTGMQTRILELLSPDYQTVEILADIIHGNRQYVGSIKSQICKIRSKTDYGIIVSRIGLGYAIGKDFIIKIYK
jgi:hypothetical protein